MKKLVSLVLALAMILSIGVAYAETYDRVQSVDDNEYMFWTTELDRVADMPPLFEKIQEEEDIKITWIARPEDEKEFLNLKIISGEIPDIIRDFDFPTYDSWVNQGVLAEVPVELIKEHAPNLAAWAENAAGENVWNYYMRDGKNYSVPIMWTLAKDNRVLGIREDLWTAAGVTEFPTTIEEMGTALEQIKSSLNIAPLTATSLQFGLDWVFGAYGAYLNFHVNDETGELEYGYIEDGAKEALAVLADWYAKGLIDPEFYVNTDQTMQDKWDAGQAAILEHEWYFFVPQACFYLGQFYENCMALNPDAKVSMIQAPTGNGTDHGFALGNVVTSSGLQFGAHLSQEKIARYLELFDKYSFTESMLVTQWGIEGETYTYTEEGGVQFLEGYQTQEEKDAYGIGIMNIPGCFNDYDLQAKFMTAPEYRELRFEAPTYSSGEQDVLSPVYRPIYNEKIEALNMIVNQGFIDIITGARPVDDFEAIREEWLANGGQEVMDESIAAYAAMQG